jgi:hypothetical protein
MEQHAHPRRRYRPAVYSVVEEGTHALNSISHIQAHLLNIGAAHHLLE